MTFLAHIAERVLNRPLLISPDKAAVIIAVLGGRIGASGVTPAPEANRFEGDSVTRDPATGAVTGHPYRIVGKTAIISVVGSLVNRGAYLGAYSGVTSYEGIQFQLKQARNASQVANVVLDISSPGGEALGAFETGSMVRELAAVKPVTAFVNGMAASAAYAIAAGASEIVISETSVVGSIGVVLLHADFSKYLEAEGVKPTLIFAGAHKVDGNPYEPLTDAVRSDLQDEVNGLYQAFLNSVAVGRGERLTADMARATEARTLMGKAAIKAGLADRIGTFEMVLADLTRAAGRTSSSKGRSMTEPNGAPAAETNAGITQAQLDTAVANAVAQTQANAAAALEAERGRMAALDQLAAKCAGNAKGLDMVAAAKASGASAEATALAMVAADVFTHAAVIGALAVDDASARGAAPAAPGASATKPGTAQTREGLMAEWAATPALQRDYLTAESYASAILFDRKKG